MKVQYVVLGLLMAFVLLPGLVSAASPGQIPEVGNISGQIPQVGNLSAPTTSEDITGGLGVFADLGKFLLEYAVHIAIFIMVLAVVVLSLRGSWARSNNKLDEAVDTQRNQKGLIVDGILAMFALLFIFYILAPFVKSFIPM
ncbi:MAG: hypothetical protein PHW84_01945 [Methanosarcina sp.]|nr:hypothetical protein [Methanosarcina sp.]